MQTLWSIFLSLNVKLVYNCYKQTVEIVVKNFRYTPYIEEEQEEEEQEQEEQEQEEER